MIFNVHFYILFDFFRLSVCQSNSCPSICLYLGLFLGRLILLFFASLMPFLGIVGQSHYIMSETLLKNCCIIIMIVNSKTILFQLNTFLFIYFVCLLCYEWISKTLTSQLIKTTNPLIARPLSWSPNCAW